jgi:pilus assembly protein CpaE
MCFVKPSRATLRACLRDEGGLSATEFALLAPVLVFSLLAMVDIGLAVYERMTIDAVLRAGAQSAMADPGKDQVLKVLQTSAAKHFTLSGSSAVTAGRESLTLTAERYCSCRESPDLVVPCSSVCASSLTTFTFYRLTGSKQFGSIVLQQIALNSTVQVQVR